MAERSTESTAKLTEAKAKAEARDKCKKFSSASPGIDWIGIPMKGLRFFRHRWTRQTDPRGTQPASQPASRTARQPDSQTDRPHTITRPILAVDTISPAFKLSMVHFDSTSNRLIAWIWAQRNALGVFSALRTYLVQCTPSNCVPICTQSQ